MLASGVRRSSPLSFSFARTVTLGRTRLLCTRRHQQPKGLPRAATKSATSAKITRRQLSGGSRSKSDAPPPRPAPDPLHKSTPKPSLFSAYLGRYTALLESRPLATKAITSGVIAFAGDITCQLMAIEISLRENSAEELEDESQLGGGSAAVAPSNIKSIAADTDWGRTARFTFLGAALLAPALHLWYGFLIRRLPGTALATVVDRVVLDQLVFAPVFLAGFLSSVMVLDGNAAKIAPKLRADYSTTLVGNWGYWIPAQLINFRFVAPVYQVLYANSVGFFWNIYLSYQSNKAVIKDSASSSDGLPPSSQND